MVPRLDYILVYYNIVARANSLAQDSNSSGVDVYLNCVNSNLH